MFLNVSDGKPSIIWLSLSITCMNQLDSKRDDTHTVTLGFGHLMLSHGCSSWPWEWWWSWWYLRWLVSRSFTLFFVKQRHTSCMICWFEWLKIIIELKILGKKVIVVSFEFLVWLSSWLSKFSHGQCLVGRIDLRTIGSHFGLNLFRGSSLSILWVCRRMIDWLLLDVDTVG